jgi:hypothetical protein
VGIMQERAISRSYLYPEGVPLRQTKIPWNETLSPPPLLVATITARGVRVTERMRHDALEVLQQLDLQSTGTSLDKPAAGLTIVPVDDMAVCSRSTLPNITSTMLVIGRVIRFSIALRHTEI